MNNLITYEQLTKILEDYYDLSEIGMPEEPEDYNDTVWNLYIDKLLEVINEKE